MKNEQEQDTQVQVEDKTSDSSDNQMEEKNESTNEDNNAFKTALAQKAKWKEKAVDPQSGKTYKELYEESLKSGQNPDEVEKQENSKNKSDEPDYSKIAFLEGRKVTHPDDQKAVMDEAKRLKMPLTDVLNMKHMQQQLKDASDQRESESNSPQGSGRSGGGSKNSIESYIAKGTMPEDQETAEKVVAEKIRREESKNMFSDHMFTN